MTTSRRRLTRCRSMARLTGFSCLMAALFAPAASGKTLALLVGVTEYPHLRTHPLYDARIRLRGPLNDAHAFKKLLIDKFGVDEQSITLLVEGLGSARRPTSTNIEREFKRLADTAEAGDIIVILMSGHGDQLPARGDDPDNVEPDGWDEVFLPADVSFWNPKTRIDNAITDNQFRKWLAAIEVKKAFVWIIFDSCHSYSLVRGSRDEHIRTLGSEILIPTAYRETAEAQARVARRRVAERSRGQTPGFEGMVDGFATMKRTVALYAALADEPAPELGLPREAPLRQRQRYGLLTYTVIKVLNECGRKITYSELLDRILSDYRATRLNRQPTPCAEGALQLQVLGLQRWPQRSRILLSEKAEAWEVNAGTLMGLTPGSILAVYPPAEAARSNVEIGFAKVLDAAPTSATVSPCDRHGQPASFDLPRRPAQARCELVEQHFGDMQLKVACRVAVPPRGLSRPGLDRRAALRAVASEADVPAPLREALASMRRELGEIIRFTPHREEADWVLDVVGDRCRLLDFVGVLDGEPSLGGRWISDHVFGPFDMRDTARLTTQLSEHFQRIYKWQNLLRIAGAGGPVVSDSDETALEVKFYTCDDEAGRDRREVTGDALQVGQYLDIRLRNIGQKDLDVTVLYLDEDFGVSTLFPVGGRGNRIEAYRGEVPPEIPVRPGNALIKIAETNRVREHLMAIAVPSHPRQKPIDFSFLEQRSLEDARGTDPVVDMPVGRLLTMAAFGDRTRGSLSVSVHADTRPLLYLKSWRAIGVSMPERFGANAEFDLTPENLNTVISPVALAEWRPRASDESPRGLGVELFAKVAPAVVVVRTLDGQGTGFLFRAAGFDDGAYILTNYHVVSTGTTLDAKRHGSVALIHLGRMNHEGLMRHDETARPALLLAVDQQRDLALLRLTDPPAGVGKLPAIPLTRKPPRPGESCAIIGHPSSGMLWTYRSCEVAQIGRSPDDLVNVVVACLQASKDDRKELEAQLALMPSRRIVMTTCQTNPGDSGGPVVNKAGELIAVTFAIPGDLTEAKFSYHIHVGEVRAFLAEANRTPLVLVPDAWDLGPQFEMVDLFGTGRNQAIISGSEGPYQMIIDLDEDTKASVLTTSDLQALKDHFDAEFALRRYPAQLVAFYDRDNDRHFDLILIDDDMDQYADRSYVLGPKEHWSMEESTYQRMIDPSMFPKGSKLADAMMRIDKDLSAGTP